MSDNNSKVLLLGAGALALGVAAGWVLRKPPPPELCNCPSDALYWKCITWADLNIPLIDTTVNSNGWVNPLSFPLSNILANPGFATFRIPTDFVVPEGSTVDSSIGSVDQPIPVPMRPTAVYIVLPFVFIDSTGAEKQGNFYLNRDGSFLMTGPDGEGFLPGSVIKAQTLTFSYGGGN
jgi:hypothetical protein